MIRWTFGILLALVLGAATTVAIALACARWSRPTTFSGGSFTYVDGDTPEIRWVATLHPRSFLANFSWSDQQMIDPADIDPSPSSEWRLQSLAKRIPLRYPNVVWSDFSPSGNFIITGCGVLWMRAMRVEQFVLAPSGGGFSHMPVYDMIEKQYGWPLLCLSSGDHETSWSVGNRGVVDCSSVLYDINGRYHGSPSHGMDRALDRPRVILWPGFLVNTLLFSTPWLLGMIGIAGARKRLRRRRGWCPVCVYDLRGDFAAGCPECGWGRAAEEPRALPANQG